VLEQSLRLDKRFSSKTVSSTSPSCISLNDVKTKLTATHPILRYYTWSIITLGAMVFFASAVRLDYAQVPYSYFIFAVVTLVFSSRITVQIPGVKGHISVSDTFIFLSIFLFGGEAGILLSTIDAVAGSYGISNRRRTLLFNVAVFSISTFINVWTLRLFFGSIPDLVHDSLTSTNVAGICTMGLVQYLVNSGLASTYVALRSGQPVWHTWKDRFLWTSLTYFAGASAAAIIAKLIGLIGIYAFLAAMPIVAVVYFTYTTYLKNVQSASAQAELAERHVEELSHYISEQARISKALEESEKYFRNAFHHAAGMAVVDPAGNWLQVNDSLCKMLGYSNHELLQQGFQAVTHPDDLGNDLDNLNLLLQGKISNYQLEKRYRHKTGSTVWALQSASVIREESGDPRHIIFQVQDISDRKKAEELMHHAAFHDALTGLPNRTHFTDRLKIAIERAKRSADFQFAVIFLDLDRFKIVNDSLGHDSGDKLLIELSRRLEFCIRTVDVVARLGGDEFAVLLDGIPALAEAEAVAVRIQESLKSPFEVDGEKFRTTVSMGIAYSTLGYTSPEDILRDADTAMYQAKANGKARHEIFARHMHTWALKALTVENELRHAVDNEEIEPYYQPIVSLEDSEVVGFEALARWVHPSRGLISPADFISLAEETELIVPLGLSIMEQACRQTVEWQTELSRPDLSISVNLSPKQFKEAGLVNDIRRILRETDLRPSALKVEITETMFIDDLSGAIDMLKQLRRLGIQVSIDDFGTGYSSLNYLHKFPFDVLKVDRTFINRMPRHMESRGIVKAIVLLAAELGKEVIAEGVQTAEQHRLLTMVGCHYGQGYLFSKALDAESAGQLIQIRKPWKIVAPNLTAEPLQVIG